MVWKLLAILFLVPSLCFGQTTITKGPIGEEDINHYDGVTSTFTRPSSVGATLTLHKVGGEVDALQYGGWVNYTNTTITSALTAIGTTNKRVLVLRPGTWTISTNVDWSTYTNVTFKVLPGALLSHSTYTMKIPNPSAEPFQWLSGTGAVTFYGNYVEAYPEWFGAVKDGVSDDYTPIQAALTAATGSVVKLGSGTYAIGTLLNVPTKTTFKGAGKNTTKLLGLDSGVGVKAGQQATVSDMTMDADNQTATTCFWAEGVDNVDFHNLLAVNCTYHGFALSNGANRNKMHNISALAIGSRGLIISVSSYNVVDNLYCYGCTNACVNVDHNAHHNVISDVFAEHGYYAGLWVHNEAYANTFNNFVITDTTNAVAYNPGALCGWNCYNNVFNNFYIDTYYTGFLVRGGDADVGYADGNTRDNVFSNMRLVGPGLGVANTFGVQIDSYDSGVTISEYNNFSNLKITDFYYGIGDPNGDGALYNSFIGIDTSDQITVTYSLAYLDSQSRISHWLGFTPAGDLSVSQPAFPSTGVAVTNEYPYTVQVYIIDMPAGGTVAIDGVDTGSPNDGNGMYMLGTRQTITPTYGSGSPSWKWFGL